MADVQTPVVDIEEEVEVPQDDAVEEPTKPVEAFVSTAAAEVGQDAVEASKSVDEALDKLVAEEKKVPVEEKKPEEKKDEKKKSKKSVKVEDDGEGDIAGGIEQLSAMC